MVRRIHAVNPLPLSDLPDALEAMDHKGMNLGCKGYILTWLRASDHIHRENKIIEETISDVKEILYH